MAAGRNNNREFLDDIWKFLDHEESDYESIGQVRERVNSEPSKQFLKPATFGAFRSSTVSVDDQHIHDDIQLTKFSQKYSGNVQEGAFRPVSSQFRLPRTVIKDEDPDAIYAVPKKLPRTTDDRGSLSSVEYDPGTLSSFFKRYETGSILSTVRNEHRPVINHNRKTFVRTMDRTPEEFYADNVVFSGLEDLYSKPQKRLAVKRKGKAGGRRNCSGKVIVAVVLAFMVVGAIVAIAAGVSVAMEHNGDSTSFNSTTINAASLVTKGIQVTGPVNENGLVVATSPSPHNIGFNFSEATSASQSDVRFLTLVSHNGISASLPSTVYVDTDLTLSSQENLISEENTNFTNIPSDGLKVRTTTTPDRIKETSVLGSNSWTSVSLSTTGFSNTLSKIRDISSSPQAVTSSLAKSSHEASTTAVGKSLSSSSTSHVTNITSESVTHLTTPSADSSVGYSSVNDVSSVTNASANMTASNSTV